ncbi:MAG: DNA alkylation repair protein [Anaerolineae bacterium]|nr:DNA alkylation repair protein [Anaerolineae bacterium]
MKTQEARELGERIAILVRDGQVVGAYDLLSPVLAERTPFDMLRCIGEPVGACPQKATDAFLDLIATDKTEGGWVVIQSALEQMLDRDLAGAFVRCRDFIVAADVWYAADTLGEGVVGQALVRHFEPALEQLVIWHEDDNAWVRRAVGTGVHFWAKRSHGAAELRSQAEALLTFLEPMWGEWEMDAVKGVGWGLKTLGRHYPDLMADWLPEQVGRRHRVLMLRKAMKGLSAEQKARIGGAQKTA